MKNNPKLQQLLSRLKAKLDKLQRYSLVGFLVLLVAVYGFILFRSQTLDTQPPTSEAVNDQVQSIHVPHIDQQVVKQLQTLHDNSVSVQTLFDEARKNPFQE